MSLKIAIEKLGKLATAIKDKMDYEHKSQERSLSKDEHNYHCGAEDAYRITYDIVLQYKIVLERKYKEEIGNKRS